MRHLSAEQSERIGRAPRSPWQRDAASVKHLPPDDGGRHAHASLHRTRRENSAVSRKRHPPPRASINEGKCDWRADWGHLSARAATPEMRRAMGASDTRPPSAVTPSGDAIVRTLTRIDSPRAQIDGCVTVRRLRGRKRQRPGPVRPARGETRQCAPNEASADVPR